MIGVVTQNSTNGVGFRKTISIQPFNTPISSVGTWVIFVDTANIKNGYLNNNGGASPAVNDEVNYDINIGPGTYTFELLTIKNTDGGIVTLQLDGSSIGTIDLYNGSRTDNQLLSVTGIVVPVGKKYRLKLLVATKNGSSSNYRYWNQGIYIRRTA